MSHTPGPWKLDGSSITAQWEDGETVQVALLSTTRWAGTNPKEREASNRMKRENEANARLIAACPTMYNYVSRQANEGDKWAQKIIGKINA